MHLLDSDPIRRMVCAAMLNRPDVLAIHDSTPIGNALHPSPFIDRVMIDFIKFWKMPRNALRDLIFTCILPEFDFKKIFAAKFAEVRA